MKQLVRYSFLTSVALIVAACGQTPQGNGGGQQAQNGLLEVVVQGVAQAPITVSGASGAVFSGAVSGTKDLTLPAGAYFVDGAPTSGFRDPSPLSVTVGANQTVKAFVPYQAAPPPSGNVASVTIQSVTDASGALPTAWEGNSNAVKPVGLYAAQTEEPVVVRVLATDAAGAPVANANVVVNLSELFGDHVAIIRGAATSMLGTMSKSAVKPLAFRDGITTDASGVATFTLFATYGASPASLESELLMFNQPAKIVVAAENGNATSVLNEFKVFFYNITHLYFTEGNSEQYTGQRLGKTFTLTNLFKPLTVTDLTHGDSLVNTFTGGVSLYQKQPRTRIGDSMDSLLPDGGTFLMTYTLDDTTHFHFVPGSFGTVLKSDASGNPMVVANGLNGQIKIAPNDGLGLTSLPLTANVHVQLWVSAFYGDEGNSISNGVPPFDGTTTGTAAPYWFALKDFTIHKTWIGSYLSIAKTIDHHVLTWAGPEHHLAFVADPAHPEVNTLNNSHTLASSNDPAVAAGSVFTSTVTLTLKNQGNDPVYNVTLADALPAELGVITSTAVPSGATYDSNTHVITWNDQNTGLPIFNTLAPGASITATFQVYLRQKPGFAMDPAAYQKALGYQVKPIILGGGRYPDPYAVVNGDKINDVTGTWFSGAPLGQGGWQAKVDFDGNLHSADAIVNGVRPIYTLDKTITYQPTVPASVGDVIYYHIHAVNTERTNAGEPYAALAAQYPNEFDSTLGRDNPYGRNVRITD
ncbi:MAG TPA: hypothetical protein VHN99_09425, partial [Deinococcales bacterium]|nr:hypothetical protein [Deinococcales bacterium]